MPKHSLLRYILTRSATSRRETLPLSPDNLRSTQPTRSSAPSASVVADPDPAEITGTFPEKLAAIARMRAAAAVPILDDMRRIGIDVDDVYMIYKYIDDFPQAVPILLEHLERGGYPDMVASGTARALGTKVALPY
jgi:hypothetical protein